MQLAAGVRIGKYEIGKKLGQGGFGVLYQARDTELDREIAIKILRPEHVFKPQVVQRFLQEARAAARINHPGIVTVHESGHVSGTNTLADGTVYIAMELLAGDTLQQRIHKNGKLPIGIAIGMCRQMADALAAAHVANIIHRDLKPANIFLVRDPAVLGGERVKVLDFGIAKLADDFGGAVQTHSLVMLGTPMYMSPEQCKSSAKVDARSDIYTLGCILFEMITGKTPFAGDSGELIAKHQLVAPPTARSLMPEIPTELDQLISSMLAKSLDERPQTMTAVIDVLDAIEERIAPAPEMQDEKTDDALANITTMASGGAAAQSNPSTLRTRAPVIAVAALAILAGIIGGVIAMGGDDNPIATASPTPPAPIAKADEVPRDVVAPTPVAEPTPVVAPDMGSGSGSGSAIEETPPGETETPPTEQPTIEIEEPMNASGGGAKGASTKTKTKTKTIAPAPPETVVASPANCDAELSKEKGMTHINGGQHAAALAQFEASLRCKDDPFVRQLAFMEACASGNSPKAKLYYKKLTASQQDKFGQICKRQKPPVAYQDSCDAEAAKERGMSFINAGEHAASLAAFEASLACKDDPYVRQLAFVESCASGNSPKAKVYYKKLTAAQQSKFAQICIRQNPPVPYE